MEAVLWFALGSVAGAAITGWGRPVAMAITTTAIRAGDAVGEAAGKVGGTVGEAAGKVRDAMAARTAEQRKSLESFFEEAKSRARAPGPAEPAPAGL
jgi:hypothetical protein